MASPDGEFVVKKRRLADSGGQARTRSAGVSPAAFRTIAGGTPALREPLLIPGPIRHNPVTQTHREDRMISQHDGTIDRRLFLGAAGALTLAGQPALAAEVKAETKIDAKTEAKPADAKRLSDTI